MTTQSTEARTLALSDGTEIPLLGVGVWQVPDGPTPLNTVRWALCEDGTEVLADEVARTVKRALCGDPALLYPVAAG